MPDNKEINRLIGVKIGSTYSVSAAREEHETPVTNVIKSCVSPVTDPDTTVLNDTYIGVERPDSVFPLDKGIIENDANILLTIAIINKLNIPPGAYVVAAIPALELTDGRARLKRALLESLKPAKMVLSPEVYCGAVTALGYSEINGKQRLKALHSDFLALNLGSTTTEVLIALHGERKYLKAFTKVCGNMVDSELFDTLHNTFGKVLITMPQIRDIKEQFNMINQKDVIVNVLTHSDGVKKVPVQKVVMSVLDNYVFNVSDLLVNILKNNLTPETIAQVLDTPIVLTGGMNNIPGLAERIEKKMRELLHYEKLTVLKQVDGHIAPAIGALTLSTEINWEKIPVA
ncbi:MAG: rod shape-determining protein [Candidatus Ratteibacteria bacterium]|nr:rod shape-determining protein [Candidatus Ratteibacteria bacterium]